ncbi:MAG: BufA2 family periplasmic bufferin-type metallophore [Gammaproteobacteria bacterium]
MVTRKTSGLLLATAAAAFFISGPVTAQETNMAEEAKVHCGGINACKGQSECKTATNECKGQNACQGKGFISTTAQECEEKGGTVLEG